MANESTKKGKTNSHGVTAPVRPRTASSNSVSSENRTTIKSRDSQIKRLATKHKTAFSLLAKR